MKYLLLAALLLPATVFLPMSDDSLNRDSYNRMARRIVLALRPERGERVILRFDPATMPELEPVLRRMLEEAGAIVETLNYGPAADLEQRLARADVYIWLPAGLQAVTPVDQAALLARWLDSGKGRQVHFHWGDGTRAADGLNGSHSNAYDRVYLDALDIDYAALDREMELAIAKMRAAEVRVTTPAGTDIRFRVGDRPFSKQNGDASRARMQTARVRIDREIELPAGALRVAPIEETVSGVMVIPRARVGGVEVNRIRLEFDKGLITRATSADHEDALRKYLAPASSFTPFREFALGMNPKLVVPKSQQWLPYYGYGAGVVRLGLGDNSELGGSARGFPVRWLFFPDATVRAGGEVIVEGGRLTLKR